MRLALPLLLLVPLLAGCLGDDPVSPAATEDTPRHPSVDEATPDAAPPQPEAPATGELPLREEDTLKTTLTVCPPARHHCVAAPAEGWWYTEGEVGGALRAAHLQLTWTPTNELTRELIVMLVACDAETCEYLGHARGGSPLELHLEGIEGALPWYGIEVTTPNRAPSGVGVTFHVDQPFVLEGKLAWEGLG